MPEAAQAFTAGCCLCCFYGACRREEGWERPPHLKSVSIDLVIQSDKEIPSSKNAYPSLIVATSAFLKGRDLGLSSQVCFLRRC